MTGNSLMIFPQGNTIESLSGYGNSGLINSTSNISGLNPAALNNIKNKSAGISYQFESGINDVWIGVFKYKRITNFVPQSAGFILPYKNWRFGLSMSQHYNSFIFTPPIPVTTMEQPDGTGEFITAEYRTNLYDYSIITSYVFENIFNNAELSVGTRIGWGNLIYNASLADVQADIKDNSTTFSIGGVYKQKLEDKKYIQLGLYYESGTNFKSQYSYNGKGAFRSNDSNYYQIQTSNLPFEAKFPSKMQFDFDVDIISNLKLLGNLSYIFWKDVKTNAANNIEFSFSGFYEFNDLFSASAGFYNATLNFDYVPPILGSDINKEMKALYLTAGFVINLKEFKIDAAFADSHLISGAYRQQTIGKLGIGYNF